MKNNTNNIVVKHSCKPCIFDKTVLIDFANEIGSDTLIDGLASLFLESTPATLAVIQEAWKDGDSETLKQSFHSLKGSAATLGMMELADMCAGLELTYRTTKNPTVTLETLDSLKTASQKASQALKDFLKTL